MTVRDRQQQLEVIFPGAPPLDLKLVRARQIFVLYWP
jgi:hypothetical protein